MHDKILIWRSLLGPLSLAAYITWAAVGFALWKNSAGVASAVLMASFLGAIIYRGIEARAKRRPVAINAALVVLVASLFALLAMGPQSTLPVLLIIVAEELAATFHARLAWTLLLSINALFLVILVLLWREPNPLFLLALYGGFECFAAVTAGALKRAEAATADLRSLNAELLATRSLLSESARDGERLRVSRELHDVAGHKLTALALNLEVLRHDSDLTGRRELELAGTLSTELLADLRNVVSSLRRDDGLDIREALRRVTEIFPKPRVHLHVDDGRVVGAERAEALVRTAQEALTNAARHARADNVWLSLRRCGEEIELIVEDDGKFKGLAKQGKRSHRHARAYRAARRHARDGRRSAQRLPYRGAVHQRTPILNIRVALADDQEMVREGIKALLTRLGIEVVAEASDGIGLLTQLATVEVDVIVSDIRMPRLDGIGMVRQLRALGIQTPVVMLTTFDDDTQMLAAVEAGAQAFLLKGASSEDLRQAIEQTHRGSNWLAPVAMGPVRERVKYSDGEASFEQLNSREIAVLRLLAGGYSNKEIARSLHLAEGTVKNHVSDILGKLGTRDRTRAVLKAITLRIV